MLCGRGVTTWLPEPAGVGITDVLPVAARVTERELEVIRGGGHTANPEGQLQGLIPASLHGLHAVLREAVERRRRFGQTIHEVVPLHFQAAEGGTVTLDVAPAIVL